MWYSFIGVLMCLALLLILFCIYFYIFYEDGAIFLLLVVEYTTLILIVCTLLYACNLVVALIIIIIIVYVVGSYWFTCHKHLKYNVGGLPILTYFICHSLASKIHSWRRFSAFSCTKTWILIILSFLIFLEVSSPLIIWK